ncbi:hypothetical protein OJAV_G00212850 [Oryzias javanicus]|uniref:Uncharacterized protein n=1 Tax=Oryzias javanicus TaxID=123683 RepID=A0A3S2NUV2_ORYJA|nr:hypothetical protein OJAV_G00212850 [Oryzias javanicus]
MDSSGRLSEYMDNKQYSAITGAEKGLSPEECRQSRWELTLRISKNGFITKQQNKTRQRWPNTLKLYRFED